MVCPKCGREIDGSKRFCMYCGAEVKPAPAPGEEARPPAAAATPQYQPQAPPGPPPPGAQPTMQVPPQPAPPRPTPPVVPPGAAVPPGLAPAPPGVPHQTPYAARRPVPPAARAATAGRRGSPVAGILTVIAGATIFVSTFLSWLSTGRFFAGSGLDILRSSAEGGNFIFRYDSGMLFFSGFWSLLVGALLILAGIIMLFRGRAGGGIAVLFSIVGIGVSAVNVIMIYTKFRSNFGPISPGFGLWIFAGASICALVLGLIGLSSSG